MKRILICVALCLFVFGFIGTGYAQNANSGKGATQFNALKIKRTTGDDYKGVDTFRVDDLAGTSIWRLDKTGNLSILDSSGVTDTFIPRDRVVYITKATQLSSWGSADSAVGGQSYFQCEPGTTYLVDMYALYSSGVTAGNGVSAFTKVTFSGVSAILPNGDKYGNQGYDVTVRMVTTGGVTGYLDAGTGNSPIQVWPYPGTVAGLTAYGKPAQTYDTAYRSGNTPQSMFGPVANTVGSLVTGGSRWVINKLGEQATFSVYSGHVSSYVVSPHQPR